MIDAVTKRWIRNASDERAAADGCRFDEARGQFVVDWIHNYCKLYEGEYAGQRMELRDWQLECTMRLFGWTRYSEQWKRWVRRFRQATIFISKKNKKSPTLAAWGLYLLCGDGEPGQKVFLGAKDGTQAREIAGKHAIEMLMKSPELMQECSINKSLMQITHEPSRSIMRPMSSSNSKTQESKEGINGSILVDEVHVVDREFIARISRAGISRSEPLQIEVSTAGSNPDGYGKERFDYAVKVEAGEFVDQQFFAAIYAAPQDLNDADLADDVMKYAKMANPALGHTVDPEELLSDYERCKSDLRQLADFKMYRLNIWQRSAAPWLSPIAWDMCKRDFTIADLAGMSCYAALDLSRTRDMSALVFLFPMPDESVRVLAYFWLPEKVAKDNNYKVPFLQWAADGWLELTPGDVIDYGYIRKRYREIAAKVDVYELAFDPKYAEETTQALSDGVVSADGRSIEEGTGVQRFAYPQTLMHFTGPCKQIERLVLAGQLHHNGNPILTWQAKHCSVWHDCNQNIRPVKPEGSNLNKIDGIVAMIMAEGRHLANPIVVPSVYF